MAADQTTRKFHPYDLVTAKRPGNAPGVYERAIVIGSYGDQFGGDNHSEFTLYFEEAGECSWYSQDAMRFEARQMRPLLDMWREQDSRLREMQSNLDWIFSHGDEVLEHGYGPAIQALAACLGCYDLWGPAGEGFVWHENAMATLSHAAPFVKAGDKEGWLRYSAEYKLRVTAPREAGGGMRIAECPYCNEVRSTEQMTYCEDCEAWYCDGCDEQHWEEDACEPVAPRCAKEIKP